MAFCVSARAGLPSSLINHSGDFVTSKQYARAVNPHVFNSIGKGWTMTSYRTVYDVICAKNTRGMIYHTEIYEEMFDVNSKIAHTVRNI